MSALIIVTATVFAFLIVLSTNVIRVRRSEGVTLGDNGNERVIRAMRAQANFAEYAPFILIGLALLALNEDDPNYILALGFWFVLTRGIHFVSMAFGVWFPGRVIGTFGAFSTLITTIIILTI
ncbi:MAG: MAPEG family protein [Pseudomonadota bacterium]